MKNKWLQFFILLFFLVIVYPGLFESVMADEADLLKKMEAIILKQQEQLDAQAQAIEEMQEKLDQLILDDTTKIDEEPEQVAVQVDQKISPVMPGSEKASVKLYGHINRAVLSVNDGDDNYLYLVDNSNSQSRFGIKGTIKATDDLEIGTLIEAGFVANPSSLVNQEEKSGVGSIHFTRRHLEINAAHTRFGTFYMGHGSTASDGTSEIDLSGTTVAGYSSVQSFAGSQYFYDNAIDDHSEVIVFDAFNNMNGLGRYDRLRYDTPEFFGFKVGTSYVAGGGADLVLRYNSAFGGTKLAGAVAYAYSGDVLKETDHQINGSFSLLHSSGFNATLASGLKNYDVSGRDDGMFYYAKLGYKYGFFSLGDTCFSIDYGSYDELSPGYYGDSIGAQFVQNFNKWGTEYYLGYRRYSLDRTSTDYEDINALMTGFRVKF